MEKNKQTLLLAIVTAPTREEAAQKTNEFIKTLKPGQVMNVIVNPLVLGNTESEVTKGVFTKERTKVLRIVYDYTVMIYYQAESEVEAPAKSHSAINLST